MMLDFRVEMTEIWRARHAILAETGQSGGEGTKDKDQINHSLLPPPMRQPTQHNIAQPEDTMRDVLLDLADDLSRGIIVEWLEPADVTRLDIAYNNRALSRALRSLLCSPLTLFDVSYSTSIGKLKWAMKRRMNLGSIRIYSFSKSVSEDVWTSIALTTCLDRLRVLDIGYSDMNDALLVPLLNKCRNSLKELRFKGCKGITTDSAASIEECSELEVLHLNVAVTSMLPEIVEGLPKLQECYFYNSSLADEGVIGLAMSCPDLEMLDLSRCLRISDATIASLVQCRELKKLKLWGNNQLTDAAFAGLPEGCWPKMEILYLGGLRRLSEVSIVSLARACPSLVEVVLSDTNVTDEAVWTLCQLCPLILELYINDCPNVTDRSLVAISEHLPSLAALSCGGNNAITDDGIEKLVAKCHSIKSLRINGCRSISNRSVLLIAQYSEQRDLRRRSYSV